MVMLNKLITILVLISILLVGNVLALDWYSYVGKKVEVCVIGECYVGKVETILEIELCRQKDPLTNLCIVREIYYTMILRLPNDRLRLIRCEAIQTIEEINGK
jgi:hypothetical protein